VDREYPVVKSSHVVPRMYLRGFADEEERIAVRIRGQLEPYVMNVSNAGTRTNFYVRERPNGTQIHDIEWSLSHIEAAASPVLRSAAETWPLDLRDKATLAELFAVQLLRGPRWVEWHDQFTRSYIEEQRAKGEDESELIKLEDHLVSKTQTFVKMIDISRKVLTVIASLKWTLLEFPRPWLATSDHPVVVWPLGISAREPQATPHGGGLFETLEYRVPISPRAAILMTWGEGADTRASAYKDAAGLPQRLHRGGSVASVVPSARGLASDRVGCVDGALAVLRRRVQPRGCDECQAAGTRQPDRPAVDRQGHLRGERDADRRPRGTGDGLDGGAGQHRLDRLVAGLVR
jgi:hypothetical protein